MADIQFKRSASEEVVPTLKPGEPVMLGGHLYVADASGAPVKMATAGEVESVNTVLDAINGEVV